MKTFTHPSHLSEVEWKRQIRESIAEKIAVTNIAKKYGIAVSAMGIPQGRAVGQ